MKITQKLVERIVRLSRLTLSEEEKTCMTARLEEILGSVTSLETLRLEEELPEENAVNVLRPDEAERPCVSAGEHRRFSYLEQGGETR